MEITLPPWAPQFLAEYQKHGLKATAAASVGTTTKAIDKLALDCIEFEDAMHEAEELAADPIEREAYRRAVLGVKKGVFYRGIKMDTERVYSDSLLAKMLEAKRRRQFGNKTEITGPAGGPLQIVWRTFDLPAPPIDVTPAAGAAGTGAVLDVEFRRLQAPPDASPNPVPTGTGIFDPLPVTYLNGAPYQPSAQEIEDALSLV